VVGGAVAATVVATGAAVSGGAVVRGAAVVTGDVGSVATGVVAAVVGDGIGVAVGGGWIVVTVVLVVAFAATVFVLQAAAPNASTRATLCPWSSVLSCFSHPPGGRRVAV
jgi:hypothetical protein